MHNRTNMVRGKTPRSQANSHNQTPHIHRRHQRDQKYPTPRSSDIDQKAWKRLCPKENRPAIRGLNPRSQAHFPRQPKDLYTGNKKRAQRPKGRGKNGSRRAAQLSRPFCCPNKRTAHQAKQPARARYRPAFTPKGPEPRQRRPESTHQHEGDELQQHRRPPCRTQHQAPTVHRRKHRGSN